MEFTLLETNVELSSSIIALVGLCCLKIVKELALFSNFEKDTLRKWTEFGHSFE